MSDGDILKRRAMVPLLELDEEIVELAGRQAWPDKSDRSELIYQYENKEAICDRLALKFPWIKRDRVDYAVEVILRGLAEGITVNGRVRINDFGMFDTVETPEGDFWDVRSQEFVHRESKRRVIVKMKMPEKRYPIKINIYWENTYLVSAWGPEPGIYGTQWIEQGVVFTFGGATLAYNWPYNDKRIQWPELPYYNFPDGLATGDLSTIYKTWVVHPGGDALADEAVFYDGTEITHYEHGAKSLVQSAGPKPITEWSVYQQALAQYKLITGDT